MRKRPLSITISAWLLIVPNAAGLLLLTWVLCYPEIQIFVAQSPLPVQLRIALIFLSGVITLIGAAFLLRAANWARWLYIGGDAMMFVLTITRSSDIWIGAIPGLITYGIFVYFLLRPAANEYFRGLSPAKSL